LSWFWFERIRGRETDDDVTKPYSPKFKARMVERLTGRNAVSAIQLARETGIRQQNLSRWLMEASTLPPVTVANPPKRRTIDEKVAILAKVASSSGEEVTAFLQKECLQRGEIEQWRIALDEDGRSSRSGAARIRSLERELARKEKALAEAAALLILKKKLQDTFGVEADDTD
jgi:transposase-like protein